jgi:hypothetical protein
MPEFHIPVQPDDLLEHNGDKYVVQLPLDVSTMAPEEIVDMLEGLVFLTSSLCVFAASF